MDERNLERESRKRDALAEGRPGSVILFGAVVLAYGALTLIGVLQVYVLLAGQSPEFDTVDVRAMRSPAMQAAMWVTLVESAFLTAGGIGLIRLREWSRTLFLALALMRVAVVAYGIWFRGFEGPLQTIALSFARDLVLYGGGVWLLTRPRVVRLFRGREE